MTKSMEKKKTISKLTDFCKDLQKKQNEPEHEQKDDNKQVIKGLTLNTRGCVSHAT